MNNIPEKIKRHMSFWNRATVDRPLIAFTIGDYFPVKRYEAAHGIAQPNKKIAAGDILPKLFLEDYERLYSNSAGSGQDAFWVGVPFMGIPWMEAFFGCDIYGTGDSMIAHPLKPDWKNGMDIPELHSNSWYQKYIEFNAMLTEESKGRYPIGQPILRGVSDTLAAIFGQQDMVYAFYDEPQLVQNLCRAINSVFNQVVAEQQNTIPEFLGGHAIGFYDLWCPGKCIWFQEDMTSLLSPEIYRHFILEYNRESCDKYIFSLMHLHPSSFCILDDILNIESLKVIEINKDVGGPTIEEMMPQLKKVLEKKRLCIWGDLDDKDLYYIQKNLPANGLALNIVTKSELDAALLMKSIELNLS